MEWATKTITYVQYIHGYPFDKTNQRLYFLTTEKASTTGINYNKSVIEERNFINCHWEDFLN